MLRPTLESAIRPITTAPSAPPFQSYQQPAQVLSSQPYTPKARVRVVTSLRDMDEVLQEAKDTAAAIFFTSANCPPCRVVYPHFERLAEETGSKAVFVK